MTLTQINRAGLDAEALDRVFTIGASGSSAYTFQGEGLNGTVNNPTLYLTRGKTYRFENGSGGHPIRIQSTSGASGTAYNTGVTNNAGSGTVIVEVQHDAPDVLYYQCTSHAAMNGILYITGALADGGVTTAKLADDAVTSAKLAANAVDSNALGTNVVTTSKIAADNIVNSLIADNAVESANIVDQAVTLAKLPHGDSSSNGKFLRANNGADPTFETVNTDLVADTSPQLGGDLDTNSNHIVLNDTAQLKMGASTDFIIRHNGTDNTLGGNATTKFFNPLLEIYKLDGTKKAAAFNPDGSQQLYYNNGVRLTTTSAGINVSQLGSSFSNFAHGGGASGVRIAGPAAASGANLVFANNFDNSVSDEWAISLDGSTDDLVFKSEGAGGTDRVRFLDNGGICFGTDTATANALDDYEEGTWTPTFSGGGTFTLGGAYYTKIGRFVNFYCYITSLSIPNNSTQFRISGLPFAVASGTYGGPCSASYTGSINDSRFQNLAPNTHSGFTYIYFHTTGIGQGYVMTNAHWQVANGQNVNLQGCYITAT